MILDVWVDCDEDIVHPHVMLFYSDYSAEAMTMILDSFDKTLKEAKLREERLRQRAVSQ